VLGEYFFYCFFHVQYQVTDTFAPSILLSPSPTPCASPRHLPSPCLSSRRRAPSLCGRPDQDAVHIVQVSLILYSSVLSVSLHCNPLPVVLALRSSLSLSHRSFPLTFCFPLTTDVSTFSSFLSPESRQCPLRSPTASFTAWSISSALFLSFIER
jgi:hypothetical protein